VQSLYEQKSYLILVSNTNKEYGNLTPRIIKLLEKDPGQPVKELAEKLEVNRTFLSGYLKALENQGYIKSKKIGPAKVYFNLDENPKGGSKI